MTQVHAPNSLNSQTLYDRDFAVWIETTVALLKANQFQQIDLENLIEEVESMGKSQKSAIRNNLIVVLLHLLKWQYQPERRSKSWRSSMIEHRRRLRDYFLDSPSLRRYLDEVFDRCYEDACKQAAIETGLDLKVFPKESPFTPDQSLDSEFLP
ncbi:DUF29 domain-containing protein [Tumidithrix helvetica PCC 7403]|uniref:DUF29 domain-containing protein n=1 Tax=Tumidithrix helvetica TaxID=3457545 RepID=UPI003CB314B9